MEVLEYVVLQKHNKTLTDLISPIVFAPYRFRGNKSARRNASLVKSGPRSSRNSCPVFFGQKHARIPPKASAVAFSAAGKAENSCISYRHQDSPEPSGKTEWEVEARRSPFWRRTQVRPVLTVFTLIPDLAGTENYVPCRHLFCSTHALNNSLHSEGNGRSA